MQTASAGTTKPEFHKRSYLRHPHPGPAPARAPLAVAGLGLVAGAIAYRAGVHAARRLGATAASFVGLTEVLFAVGFAFLLLGQHMTRVQLVGGALVITGIVLVQTDTRPAPAPVPPA